MPRPGRSRTRASSRSARRAGSSPTGSPTGTSSPRQTQTRSQALDDLCCPIPEKSTTVNGNPNDCLDYVEQGQGIMRSNASIIATTFANPCTPSIRRQACLTSCATVVTDTCTSTSSSTSSSAGSDADDLDTSCDLDNQGTSCLSRRSLNTLNTTLNTSMSTSSSSRRSRQKASSRSPERGRKGSERVKSFPPPSCDLIVRVGQKEFYHSSAVLGYASDYLKSQLRLEKEKQQKRPRGSYYYIDFSHHQPEQWQVVLEYFQPRSLGVEQLTWKQVPIVLPWFTLFGLKVLLYDIDKFLLETVVTQCQGELTLDNVLLLTRISFECALVTTQSQARQWLKARLLDPRYKNKSSSSSVQRGEQENETDDSDHNDNDVGSVLAWSLADLQLLSSILTEFDTLRDYLWESSIIQFLPHDLAVNDSKTLTKSPLFPYLLREGMMQLCIVERAQFLIEKTRALPADTELLEVNSILDIKLNHSNCDSNNSVMTPVQELWSQERLYGLLQGVVEHLDAFALENEQASKRKTLPRENGRTTSRKASSRSQSKSKSKHHGPQNDDTAMVTDTNGNISSPRVARCSDTSSDAYCSPERPPVRVPARIAPSWEGDPANDNFLFERDIDPTMYMYNLDFATSPNPPAPRSNRTFEC